MLTGMIEMTSGKANIFNFDIETEMNDIRHLNGTFNFLQYLKELPNIKLMKK